MKKPYKDQVLGFICLAIALFFSWQTMLLPPTTLQGDPGPQVFPAVACFIIGLCGIILVVSPDKKPGRPFMTKEEWIRAGVLYGLYLAYWFLLWLVGYKLAVPVVLFAISTLFSRNKKIKWIWILLYTVGFTAFIFFLYRVVLQTRLPEGILFG